MSNFIVFTKQEKDLQSNQNEEIGNFVVSRIETARGMQLANDEPLRRTFPFLHEAFMDRYA